MRYALILFILLIWCGMANSQPSTKNINLTGMERTWDSPKLRSNLLIKKINELKGHGFQGIRLPLAIGYHLESNSGFLRELRALVRYTENQKIPLTLCYFDPDLNENNKSKKLEDISRNWLKVLNQLDSKSQYLSIELVNEPNLNPDSWVNFSEVLVSQIRERHAEIPILIGATNFNSLYELSRMEPIQAAGPIVYIFHFYEPIIFTHQGAEWTGEQNATQGIPYPFQQEKMPSLNPRAKGTAGEINLRDYPQTGNQIALEDKISQIAAWAMRNQVALWCTEYGVSKNADPESRQNYLRDVEKTLNDYNIPGFLWEWEGNFGVKSLVRKSQ